MRIWPFSGQHGLQFQYRPTYGAPLVRTQLFLQAGMGWLKLQLWGDPQRPLGTLGPLVGDHLVTLGVSIKPWGAMESHVAEGGVWRANKSQESLFEVRCQRH